MDYWLGFLGRFFEVEKHQLNTLPAGLKGWVYLISFIAEWQKSIILHEFMLTYKGRIPWLCRTD